MKLVSLNIGLPQEVMWQGTRITTGIFKLPVNNPVMLRRLNLDGDRQADLSVHGGVSKAVYAYPAEHYEFWKSELPEMKLPCGMFGENLTTEGLFEDKMNVGDRYRIGDAEVMVTEPRMPCYKLGIKFGRTDILRRFLASQKTGFYFSVLQEGAIQAGDSFKLLSEDENRFSIHDITRLYAFEKENVELLRRAVQVDTLSESWRGYFEHQLKRLTSKNSL